MIKIDSVKISAKKNIDLKEYVRESFKIKDTITDFSVIKKSLDAREKEDIKYVYSFKLSLSEKTESFLIKKYKNVSFYEETDYSSNLDGIIKEYYPENDSDKKNIVIVGMGPAGLFAAYALSNSGHNITLIERGKCIEERISDVDKFWSENILDYNSNVQFGEGGAGTFSDGKLNTGVKDPAGRKDFVLKTFVECGAKDNILYDSKPHIGTDDLRNVIINLRNKLIERNVKVLFSTQFVGIKESGNTVKSVTLKDIKKNEEYDIDCDTLILAIGHSSRDTFKELNKKLDMKPKPFAMGFRVIHEQSFIDKSQYGDDFENLYEDLEPSPYKLTYQGENRGVYTFCMCPGGFVVNASSEDKKTCINGMSYNKRDSGYANSAVIVQIKDEDLDENDVFSGLKMQEEIEEKTYALGNGKIPVSTLKDFFKNTDYKYDFEFSSCKIVTDNAIKGEIFKTDISGIYPEWLNNDFCDAMCYFDRKIKGYAKTNPLLAASEVRSSSPVKIIRDDAYEANIKGIYPCGEGAGYAGGIISAAMDGIKVAEAVILK